jgi:hypothetical protein
MNSETQKAQRVERVVFETDRFLIVGDVTLPPDGYQSRFSDSLNRADVAFIRLIDAEITPLGGGEAERRDFIVVNKAHVRLAYPLSQS